jgi:DnaK suppressor protein
MKVSPEMDKKKVDKFREQLETRRDELKKIVARNEQDGREADVANAQDIADRAANSYTKEFLFHQSNSERQMLSLIEGALGRLREGAFGECVNCGNEINPKRLEAVPWTRYCIECQEKLEKGQLEQVT